MQLPRAKLPSLECGLQQIPAFGKIAKDRARLVLPPPAANCGADDAHQRGRMKRSLQECDVAERLPEPRSIGIALGTAALMRQQHDRKIRPWRLIIEPVHQATQIHGLDRLVGDHGEARAALDLAQQCCEIAAGLRMVACLTDQGGGDRCVAALRRENDGPLG